jgi:tetratricopeptide (TPR) repeat protein
MGTPNYIPPEQAEGRTKTIGPAVDVYALGAILYEMLTGRPPFTGESMMDVLRNVVNDDPVAPRRIDRSVPKDLETICLKSLEKKPERRYSSAKALADDLKAWSDGDPIRARPHSLLERLRRACRRHPAWTVSVVLSAAFLLTTSGVLWNYYDARRKAEFQRAQDVTKNGFSALAQAREALDAKNTALCENKLTEAEHHFHTALFLNPGDSGALSGLRESALRHFQLALDERDWRQAREKLLLAQSAGATNDELNQRKALLEQRENERSEFLRKRVDELMRDAAALPRKVQHEMAVYELIALKDPLTIELLLPFVDHESAECRRLAIAALTWMGDAKAVEPIRRHLSKDLPAADENSAKEESLSVQEAAICALCTLAPNDDRITYDAIRTRLWAEPQRLSSALYKRVEVYFEPYARRVAGTLGGPRTATAAQEYFTEAVKLTEAKQWADAISCYDKALELDPNYEEALSNRGNAKRDSGDSAGALADYNKLLELNPDYVEAYHNRGLARIDLGNIDGAIADLDRAIQLNPHYIVAYRNRAAARRAKGDLDGAISDYSKALEFLPRYAEAYNARGDTKRLKGDLPGALADINKALQINPHCAEAFNNRGLLEQMTGNWNAALADYDKAIEINPGLSDAYANRGLAKHAQGNTSAAMTDYNNALKLDPRHSKALSNRGIILQEKGDYEAAMSDYLKAVQTNPRTFETYANLGMVRHKEGTLDDAIADFDRALRFEPRYAQAYCNRGLARFGIGDLNGAEEDYRKALFFDPNLDEAYRNRANLAQARKDYSGRLSVWQQWVKTAPDSPNALNCYAWELLNSPDEKLRDAKAALPAARKAAELTQYRHPFVLDTLALALFKNSNVDEAIETEMKAIAALPEEVDEQARAPYQDRLDEFKRALQK